MNLLCAAEVQLIANVHPAHNPNLNNTRSALRPLSPRETMSRVKALAIRNSAASPTACSGQIFVGIFFDGTGNNREIDYLSVENDPQKHKHSNVVRLFHAFPDKVKRGADRYYRFYVPGVGTPFPEIGDSGGTLGKSMSWFGENRIIWGITRLFNAVSNFVAAKDFMPDAQAGELARGIGGLGSTAGRRNNVFGNILAQRLRKIVVSRQKNMPNPEQINVSVFGFSRGAAEARAFVNWLFELCKYDGGIYTFAEIPLRVDFLGIFDTVASVGVAGAFSNGMLGFEGRQSWADDNMQIHSHVESCLHIVAAHEVRATFPMDSVRIEGKYPPNVREYVYPGSHSDIGGGYTTSDQGKTDALARIAGFEMYCAALAAGVPLLTFAELDPKARAGLVPSESAITAFKNYMQSAKIPVGPVEEMMRAHMGQYFTYRYQARRKPFGHPICGEYYTRPFFRKSAAVRSKLRDTQQHFLAILAAAVETMEYRMENNEDIDAHCAQPFQNGTIGNIAPSMQRAAPFLLLSGRAMAIHEKYARSDCDKVVEGIKKKFDKWRKWLSDNNHPFLQDSDAPERDVLSVVQTIEDAPQTENIVSFFDHWVHDSMAGLAFDGLDEFIVNGIGIFKFRRIYWGDRGDAMLKEKIAAENALKIAASKQKRLQRK